MPAQIVVGAQYTANLNMTNSGTSTWDGSYWLGLIGDNAWGTTRVDAAGLAPGQTRMFSIPITATTTAGTYNFRWQMYHNGVAFGATSPATATPVIGIPPPTVNLTSTGNGRHHAEDFAYVAFVGGATAGTGTAVTSLDLIEVLPSSSATPIIKSWSPQTNINETLTITRTATPPSSRTFRLRAIDARGQSSLSSAVTIYFDPSAPTVSLSKPANGSVFILPVGASSISVQVQGSAAATAGQNLSKLDLKVDGALVPTPLTGSVNKMVQLTGGNHTITLTASDSGSVEPVTASVSVSVVPAGSAAVFSNLTLIKSTGVITAGQKFYTGINGFVKATAFGDMVNRVELREGNSVLNAVDFPFEMSNDGENPVNTERNFYNLTGGLSGGVHDIYVRALTLRDGYVDSPKYQVTVTVKAPPSVTFTPPQSLYAVPYGTTAAVRVSGVATDSDGTVSRIEVIDGTAVIDTAQGGAIDKLIPLGVGPHTLKLRAIDGDDLPGESSAYQINVTAIVTDPQVSFTAPTATSFTTVNGTATVSIAGVAAVASGRTVQALELYDGVYPNKTVATTTINDSRSYAPGNYTLGLRITDSANASSVKELPITVVAADPIVSFTLPTETTFTATNGKATVSIAGIAKVASGRTVASLELSDGVNPNKTVTTTSIEDTRTYAPGNYTLTLRVLDSNNRSTFSELPITVITASSKVKFIWPQETNFITTGDIATATATVPILGEAFPAEGRYVKKLEFQDGVNPNLVLTGGFWSISDTRNYKPGSYTLRLRMTDSSDELSVAELPITVTAPDPTVAFKAPTMKSFTVSRTKGTATVLINGEATIPSGRTVKTLELYDGRNPNKTVTTSTISDSRKYPPGNYKLGLRIIDSSDRSSVTEFPITVVTTDPKVSFDAPTVTSFTSNNGLATVSIAGTASVYGSRTIKKLELFDGVNANKSVTTPTISDTRSYAPGTHLLRLRVIDSEDETAIAELSITVFAQGDASTVVSESTPPPKLQVRQPYTIGVAFKNTGITTWNSGSYRLSSQNPLGNRTWVDTATIQVPQSVAPGETITFNIPVTAPRMPGIYTMQWQMLSGATPFGAATQLRSIAVEQGVGPTATLSTSYQSGKISPVNWSFTAVGTASTSTTPLKKLEIFRDDSDGKGYLSVASINQTSNTYTWTPTLSFGAGIHLFKLRVTDATDASTDSEPVVVSVEASSSISGVVQEIRSGEDKKLELRAYACEAGIAAPLAYELLVGAPSITTGGTVLKSGIANEKTDSDDGSESCTPRYKAHGLVIDIKPYQHQYAGQPLFVVAKTMAGNGRWVLTCSSYTCVMPSAARIGLATPTTGDRYVGPAAVFMRGVITGLPPEAEDLVEFSVDGGPWSAGRIDGRDSYSLIQSSIAGRSDQYSVQARLRRGNTTVYSAKSFITVGATVPVTAALIAPLEGSTFLTSTTLPLMARVSGEVSAISSVKFYANGNLIASGSNSNAEWNTWTAYWLNQSVGNYTIVAKAYDASGVLLATTSSVTMSVTGAATSSTPIAVTLDVPELLLPDAGTLDGELGVNGDGEATYAVALELPPGTGGLTPELSLSYSGAGTNSFIGLGWNLNGLSSIHRCGKTIAQDNVNRAVSFEVSDRLCLDGQRLVRVNGPAPADTSAASLDIAYWSVNGEYRTETDTFNRITSVPGPTIAGVASTIAFKVETKEGAVRYYGCDVTSMAGCASTNVSNSYVAVASSRLFPQDLVNNVPDTRKLGQAVSWGLSAIVDESGNYIDFLYKLDPNTGEHLPLQVRYGGNFLAPQSPHSAVRFAYQGRPDAWKKYRADARSDLRSRLTSINTFVSTGGSSSMTSGTQVRNYELLYQTSPTSGRSLLLSLQVCPGSATSATNAACLDKTEFAWGEPNPDTAKAFVNRTPGKGWGGSSAGQCADGVNAAPCLLTFGAVPLSVSKGGVTHSDYFSFADFENNGRTSVMETRVADVSLGLPYGSISEAEFIADVMSNPKHRYGTLQRGYRYFHSTGSGFTQYSYSLSSGEYFAVLSTSDFNGDGFPDVLALTSTNADPGGTGAGVPRICLSTLKEGLPTAGANIVFDCSGSLKAVGENSLQGMPTVVDVVGDGRNAIYGPTTWNYSGVSSASLCIQDKCYENVTDLPPVLALKNVPSIFMDSYGRALFQSSYEQSIDYSGTGKAELAQWSLPTRVPTCIGRDCACDPRVSVCYRWNNTVPTVRVNAFVPPGAVPPPILKFVSNEAYSDVPYAPYGFDKPLNLGTLAGDFNASGYSGLVFGLGLTGQLSGSADVIARKFQLIQCLSTGAHLDCAPINALSYDMTVAGSKYMKPLAVADFDGDGQVDLLMIEAEPKGTAIGDQLQVCQFTSDANVKCNTWRTPDITPAQLRAAINVTGPSDVRDQLYVVDVEGTGRSQLVYYHAGRYSCDCPDWQWLEDGRWEVLSPTDPAMPKQALDKIYSVKNGLGAVSSVVYEDGLVSGTVSYTANALKYPQRQTARVGKIVSTLLTGNGAFAARKTTYKYQNPATDVAGRGALGFGSIAVTDDKNSTITTQYLQQWPFHGMVGQISVTHAGSKTMETINTPEQRSVAQVNGSVISFPYIGKSIVTRWDLTGAELGKTTTVNKFTDDGFGNLKNQIVTVEGAGETFTTETVNLYQPVTNNSWKIGLKTSVQTTKTVAGSTVSRTVGYGYDTLGRKASETVEPGVQTYQVRTSFDRTPVTGAKAFGLIRFKNQTWYDPVSRTSLSRFLNEFEYDALGRYPTAVKNAVGHKETLFSDSGTGALTKVIDANQLVTTWDFDGLGRVKSESRPDKTQLRSYFKKCDSSCPLKAATVTIKELFSLDALNGGRVRPPTLVFSDSAGHVLRTQTWSADGKATSVDQNYDEFGRLTEILQPAYTTPGHLATGYTYDDFDRITSVSSLDTNGERVFSSTEFDGYRRTLRNPLGQEMLERRNALGQLVGVSDAYGQSTSFRYDSFGNLVETVDPALNKVSIVYDNWGRRTQLVDPDLGKICYYVDPLGRVFKRSNPLLRKGAVDCAANGLGLGVSLSYDNLDRLTAQLEPEQKSYWVYDPTNAKGKLGEAYIGTLEAKTYSRSHIYDALGRPLQVSTQLFDGTYVDAIEYDAWSRVARHVYKRSGDADKVFDRRYNAFGAMYRTERNGLALKEVRQWDAAGKPVSVEFGNGVRETKMFNPYSGRLDSGSLIGPTGTPLLTEGYLYDKIGNVTQRTISRDDDDYWEGFTYDKLNRLETSSVADQTLSYKYNAIGNIVRKSGVGSYTYNEGISVKRPHAVIGFNGERNFTYDDNGNLTNDGVRSLSWTTFNMPQRISKGSKSFDFVYGPEHQRTRQRFTGDSGVVYAGAQEVVKYGTAATVKTYWPDGVGVEIVRPDAASTEMSWIHTDHLGSVVGLTDELGRYREGGRLEYDSWGKRRSPADHSSTSDALDAAIDNRGFTGHEMLDQVDLVHMNGRVYDPRSGRFLSADPFVQDPSNPQSLNRYSYVFNNPTNLTDPTGFLTEVVIKGSYAEAEAARRSRESVMRLIAEAKRLDAVSKTDAKNWKGKISFTRLGVWITAMATSQNWLQTGCLGGDLCAIDPLTGELTHLAYVEKYILPLASGDQGKDTVAALSDGVEPKKEKSEDDEKKGSKEREPLKVIKKMPNDEFLRYPKDRGTAPIGADGYSIELHHITQEDDSPLIEMTRTNHRLGKNFKENHTNTGQEKSKIGRDLFKKKQRDYWKSEWDNGRFNK
ncbi:RHS repeat-associated core domain-containing protein [Duganella sp. BuS-21]|uniref:RHS repeat-associated core domain-containing protein n=1 Tax=Duganella sp. BuS-21 TaxID=2943848 RepID=UPI0035A58CCF